MEQKLKTAEMLLIQPRSQPQTKTRHFRVRNFGGLERVLGLLRRKGIKIENMRVDNCGNYLHLRLKARSRPGRDVDKLLAKLWDCEQWKEEPS
jgi:acetolactate synthase regulatory subunit